jgi:hypothetical protein
LGFPWNEIGLPLRREGANLSKTLPPQERSMPDNPPFQISSISIGFSRIVLPSVKPDVTEDSGDPAATGPSAWRPSLERLLNGNTVIQTEAQMRDVWSQLFSEDFDGKLFDFRSTFVVLMGSSRLQLGFSFDISAAEQIIAKYQDGSEQSFLSITADITPPGAPPPVSSVFLLSAVGISRAFLGDVVYHRHRSSLSPAP